MANKANFGIGDATGYFGYGTSGTAATLGDDILISQDGITLSVSSHEVLKDWANQVIRSMPGEDLPTIQATFITTSSEVFNLIFGGADVDPNVTPAPHSFIFQMVDGADTITIEALNGVVTEVADVTFAPNDTITWTATIAADKWSITKVTTP